MDNVTSAQSMSAPLSMITSSSASAEAFMQSSRIWADGCKMLGEIMAATAQGHFDQTKAAWQAMGHVKTLKEAIDIQTGYARSSTEYSMAGAKKLIEATNQLTHDAMAPIAEQFAKLAPASGLVG